MQRTYFKPHDIVLAFYTQGNGLIELLPTRVWSMWAWYFRSSAVLIILLRVNKTIDWLMVLRNPSVNIERFFYSYTSSYLPRIIYNTVILHTLHYINTPCSVNRIKYDHD